MPAMTASTAPADVKDDLLLRIRPLLHMSKPVLQGARGGKAKLWQFFVELVSRLLCCAYASYITENKGLLTEQALLLSKESLFRQQAFAPSCANALVL